MIKLGEQAPLGGRRDLLRRPVAVSARAASLSDRAVGIATSNDTTFWSYRLGNTGIHRNQHGINFRRENGSSYSARDPRGSASTRNLGIIMEGACDREAAAVARDVAATAGIPCPTAGVDHYAWHASTGEVLHAPESADPWLTARNGYAASVTAPYAAFLAELGGPDSDELPELLIRATLEGNLSPLRNWLEDRYGPGE